MFLFFIDKDEIQKANSGENAYNGWLISAVISAYVQGVVTEIMAGKSLNVIISPLSQDRNWSRQTHRQKLISEGKYSGMTEKSNIQERPRGKCNNVINGILPPSLCEYIF